MTAFVVLLRGVNVGGRNRISMRDLRATVEALGHRDVATYIQSGNVVFRAGSEEDADAFALRTALAERLGLQVEVMVRDRAALARIMATVPFTEADPKQVLVAFLAATPSPAACRSLESVDAAPETVRVVGREAYLHLPNGVGRSVLAPVLERRLGVAATARNLTTTRTLLAMLDAIDGAEDPPDDLGRRARTD